MNSKQLATSLIEKMSEDSSIQDIIEELNLISTTEILSLAERLKAQSEIKKLHGKIHWKGDLAQMRLD